LLIPHARVQAELRSTSARRHAAQLPARMMLGHLLAAMVSTDAVLGAAGALSILFGGQRLYAGRRGGALGTPNSPAWAGMLRGAAGFTSQIAHAGGPPYQMWVSSRPCHAT